ncbi:unnamed protein product, partial [Symbiodinium sp. KB8]
MQDFEPSFVQGVMETVVPYLLDHRRYGKHSQRMPDAVKFTKHQLRIIIDNSYNDKDKDTPSMWHQNIYRCDFISIVRPATGHISDADTRAILKSSVSIVFGHDSIFIRFPSERVTSVTRFPWHLKDIRSDKSKDSRICATGSFAFSRALGPGGVIELSSPPSGMRAVKAAIPNRIFARMDDNDEADEMDVASGEEESSVAAKSAHLILDLDHKAVERVYTNVDTFRARHVQLKVVLHSDGALAYKLKVPGVMHCNVVDKKKQVKANGK